AQDEHFDPKASKENPIWHCVDFRFVRKFKRILSLQEIKTDRELKNMIVARKGNRLSITPVSGSYFSKILKILE
ncbi:MAG TPA: EVE domain-containing protein, partial [Candidatus Paceibacterota bacterium]|nr:EVE domain-containing protein [Candidatus Paceibacterota bacterium]